MHVVAPKWLVVTSEPVKSTGDHPLIRASAQL
jgi:hypothetical protein